ncbi:MAG: hypothetical protein LBC72_02245 [Spirochaetaceae bacterium]|jgi:hypothetical protein|nr:hypothetical protein [Spirochaetaceae bacterium]
MNKKVSRVVPLCLLLALPAHLFAQTGDPAPQIKVGKNGRPNWVNAPYAAYNKKYYLAYVGHAQSRAGAEAAALGNLSGYFGQSVKTELRVAESHSEDLRKGRLNAASAQSLSSETFIASDVDQLLGAEIAAVWEDGKTGTHYALAVMNKTRCAYMYTARLLMSFVQLAALVEPHEGEPSMEDVVRLYTAAKVAAEGERYARMVYLLNGTRQTLPREDEYRLKARVAARAIPVYVTVQSDSDNKIHAALSSVLTEAGFTVSEAPARYTLAARCQLSQVDLPVQPNTFARYEITVALKDTRSGGTLTTFTASGRQGHVGWNEAAARALRAAESDIKTKFAAALNAYLSSAAAH